MGAAPKAGLILVSNLIHKRPTCLFIVKWSFMRVVLLLFMLGHVSIDSPSDGLPNPPHFLASISPFLAIRPRYSSEYRMFLPVHLKIAVSFFPLFPISTKYKSSVCFTHHATKALPIFKYNK